MGIIRAAKPVYGYVRRDEEENIEKVNHAVDGLGVDIQKGGFVAILGHNGSDKSTSAEYINGLLTPTEGTVWISGMDTRDEERLQDVRRTAGTVFQNPNNQIIGNVVEEDVDSGPENIDMPTEEVWKRVEKGSKAVGMIASRFQSSNKLSGGQKQRVAIVGVMAMKPQCTILDEPAAMLDPNGRKEVIKTVHELNRAGGVIALLITHYMEGAAEADCIIVTDEGRIVMDRRSREIPSRVRRLKEYGLNVFQVTELAYELKEVGIPPSDGILTKEQLVEKLVPLIRQAQKAFEHWALG